MRSRERNPVVRCSACAGDIAARFSHPSYIETAFSMTANWTSKRSSWMTASGRTRPLTISDCVAAPSPSSVALGPKADLMHRRSYKASRAIERECTSTQSRPRQLDRWPCLAGTFRAVQIMRQGTATFPAAGVPTFVAQIAPVVARHGQRVSSIRHTYVCATWGASSLVDLDSLKASDLPLGLRVRRIQSCGTKCSLQF